MKHHHWLLLILLLPACKPAPVSEANPFPVKLEQKTLRFTEGDPQLQGIYTEPVTESDQLVLHLTGRLLWDEDVTTSVFSPVSGRVASVKGSLGDKVSAGDELASLTSPDFGQAQADAVKAEADLALAKRSLERSRDLLKQGVAPQKEVEVAETVMRDAQSEFDRAKARLAQWGGSTGGVNETFTLKAPVSGEIVERSIHAGQEVRSDQMLAGMADVAAPLFVISEPAKLWVMLDVTEQDLPHLKVGQALEIHTQAYADKGFTGRLEVIGQALDADTRTIKVRGSVDNAGRLLKAQMYATIHVITPTPKHPRVPLKAVFLREGRPFVFVRHDAHTFEMRPISTLAEDGGHMLVNQGLKAGDEVVTEGSLALESVLEAATSTANES